MLCNAVSEFSPMFSLKTEYNKSKYMHCFKQELLGINFPILNYFKQLNKNENCKVFYIQSTFYDTFIVMFLKYKRIFYLDV